MGNLWNRLRAASWKGDLRIVVRRLWLLGESLVSVRVVVLSLSVLLFVGSSGPKRLTKPILAPSPVTYITSLPGKS